jgi:hypothetical protein
MRSVLLTATAVVLLAACASQPSPEFMEKSAGERVYGVVVSLSDVPDSDILAGSACMRRDIVCSMSLRAKENQYAALAVSGRNVVGKVLVPSSMGFSPGDILQAEVSRDPARPSRFTAMGVRSHQRSPTCDWVDGSVSAGKGGVACFGWSYKSLL